mmetsp:Transcript_22589/g.57417  ORF Transcript_22589/g.57417 Transcript_22589/m.57417 type:complete len:222 (+) Transcript_22589:4167-4832(+)
MTLAVVRATGVQWPHALRAPARQALQVVAVHAAATAGLQASSILGVGCHRASSSACGASLHRGAAATGRNGGGGRTKGVPCCVGPRIQRCPSTTRLGSSIQGDVVVTECRAGQVVTAPQDVAGACRAGHELRALRGRMQGVVAGVVRAGSAQATCRQPRPHQCHHRGGLRAGHHAAYQPRCATAAAAIARLGRHRMAATAAATAAHATHHHARAPPQHLAL